MTREVDNRLRLARRPFLGSVALAALASGSAVSARRAGRRGFRAVRLRTAQVEHPLGVHCAAPSLSWEIAGKGRMQAAYRIRVASSLQALRSGKGDLWDSGRVESNAQSGIAYAGERLPSRQRCFWSVDLWDQHGNVSSSGEVGQWQMGLLDSADWKVPWFAAETEEARATRERGAVWATVPDGARNGPASFRLVFESTDGEARLILQSNDRIVRLTLDGVPLAMFDYGSLPEIKAPVGELRLPLAAGRHVLGVMVMAKPGAGVAAQLRLPDGRFITDGWQVQDKPGSGEAGWAAAPRLDPQPYFRMPPSPAHLLRRRFRWNGDGQQARLYVAALGGYDVWINGKRANDDTLQAEPVKYADHIPYRVYDVGSLLREGDNVLAAMVADGFYASYLLQTGRYSYGPPPRRIRLQLEIENADGGWSPAGGGEPWKGQAGGLLASEIYYGEDWDRRLTPIGWTEPGYDDSGWGEAWSAPEPSGALIGRIVPPVRITRTLEPAAFRATGEDRVIVDFGQNFAGRVRVRVCGKRGDKVTVRHAEILDEKGMLDRRNLRAARATDTYVLQGDPAGEVLEPRFTYQGFRYAEISGARELKAGDVTGLVLHSDLGETGLFRIDQPVVQKLWLNTLWSQRSNFMGWPTDCPQRDERVGWTGDAAVFWDTAAFNMDVGPFTRAFMTDMRDSQGPTGAFPVWAPNVHPGNFAPSEPTPGWSDAGVMLPFVSYQRYGDRSIIDENWDAMTQYVNGVLADNPDGLWVNRRGLDFGDWLSLDAKDPGDETTPKALAGTAMLARSAAQLAQMAQWTGRSDEAAHWSAERQRIGRAFAEAYVAPDGTVGNASQTSYILALHNGLVPEGLRKLAGDLLAADIRRRGTLLSTGFLGTPAALDVLADAGHVDLAFDLLLRTEFPSWGYMVKHGATTIWERWNGDAGDLSMNSFNHYALGAVCGFFYRRIAGLQPVEPGFARARIAPLVDARFRQAGCTYDSVRGRFVSDWKLDGGRLSLGVEIPENCLAEVRIPASRNARITADGMVLAKRRDFTILDRDEAAAVIEVRPGRYAFEVR
ncbi:alpha-L-rhamnosidase [Novosphingobium album (ex Hu et al. 2023)]|uniref:alpha-L-rhamnosidase n=1 Tax=Novosphingobium album (ex Hu et al. 2023) TaxID=2930093 RepID=A0ABT0B5E5_9SPHN|nr:alpha-L-rhamnosidase [Novosphingobium album (ex Hu et al. 2023)]MCJ2180238.1 glycoside hydrolase family 78 protein [Novosphingobium album (ex Hu et al. 2023)]